MIHVALLTHTTELDKLVSLGAVATSDQESTLSRVVRELITLVRLFDEVLLEEYCKDHGLLDSADIRQDLLTCSFCGSCLFLSSFYCNGCSEVTSEPMLICPGCYVEGRSCHCDTMRAVRLGDFRGALQGRNNAVGSLSNSFSLHHISTEGLAEVSERWGPWHT